MKRESVKYLIVGILIFGLNWILYTFGIRVLQFNILLSNIFSFLICTIISFIGNHFWTFNMNKKNLLLNFSSYLII